MSLDQLEMQINVLHIPMYTFSSFHFRTSSLISSSPVSWVTFLRVLCVCITETLVFRCSCNPCIRSACFLLQSSCTLILWTSDTVNCSFDGPVLKISESLVGYLLSRRAQGALLRETREGSCARCIQGKALLCLPGSFLYLLRGGVCTGFQLCF